MTRLDAIDLKILARLQSEGRITKAALAEAVNLSPTPCWERLKRFEKSGLIRGYHAEIDLDQLGAVATVLVEIVLKQHRYADFQRFETAIRNVGEIVECHATGGGIDYLLKVTTPDIDAYQRLIDRLLLAEIGIERYFTYIVTRTVKTSFQPRWRCSAASPPAEPPPEEASARRPQIRPCGLKTADLSPGRAGDDRLRTAPGRAAAPGGPVSLA
jgi:Lrp/AsnC family transcriptional regulator of ectoine degradation